MKHDVFISHSSADKPTADAVCALLESHGVRCWIAPRDILPSETWAGSIFNAIGSSRAMVIILSNDANASKHVMREVELAVRKNVVIVPFRTADIEPSPDLAYFLGSTHWLDALTPPLEARIHDLRACLEAILGRTAAAGPGAANAAQQTADREMASPSRKRETDVSPEFRDLLKQAQAGSVTAVHEVGECYAQGKGVPQNLVEAAQWYRKAAEEGYVVAQTDLGDCYANGQGVPLDYGQAVKWYRFAAEEGYVVAQTRLGDCYAHGHGVPQDLVESAQWYRLAAEQGHSPAQFVLGDNYRDGIGVPLDLDEAAAWYRQAAVQGHTVSQVRLGDCYAHGRGVSQDHVQAVEWYRQAAEAGFVVAQTQLGDCYAQGLGVCPDRAQACEWYRRAADQGYSPAVDRLSE